MPKDEVPTPGESIVPPELWNPLDTRPEPAVVTFPPASTPHFWKNRVLTFHKEVYAGNEYTQAAQLSTDANLNFVLYLFSGHLWRHHVRTVRAEFPPRDVATIYLAAAMDQITWDRRPRMERYLQPGD